MEKKKKKIYFIKSNTVFEQKFAEIWYEIVRLVFISDRRRFDRLFYFSETLWLGTVGNALTLANDYLMNMCKDE